MGGSAFGQAWFILVSGGPIMVPLAALSLVLYRDIIGLYLFVRQVPLERLIAADDEPYGRTPGRSAPASGSAALVPRSARTFEEIRRRFRQIVQSRLKYSNALLVAAPLLGLLGTVMGMLHTFRGLSQQAGLETAATVADGVARALITTQTGLMIAIPALFVTQWIRRVSESREQLLVEQRVALLKARQGGDRC